MSFKCIVADPPWNERGGGQIKRGADRHYPLVKDKDMVGVIKNSPVWLPDGDCHFWMWVTNNRLPLGLQIMEQLGFRYITNMAWCKNSIGIGQYLRGQHELCLLGVRGKTMLPAFRNVPSVVIANKQAHSVKPFQAYQMIERVSPGPRLEMFAREKRDGWTVWGNQVEKDLFDKSQQCGNCQSLE